MLLSAAAAKALFVIIMISTQGIDALKPELPLQVEDRGDMWLVKGTPYDLKHSHHRMSHMFFRKETAEVTGIMSEARFVPRGGKAYWSEYMSDDDFKRVFGPPTQFEPEGIHEMIYALYGGLINKPADAVDYATVLMQTRPGLAAIPKDDLKAEEVDTAKDKIFTPTVPTSRSSPSRARPASCSRATSKLWLDLPQCYNALNLSSFQAIERSRPIGRAPPRCSSAQDMLYGADIECCPLPAPDPAETGA